MSGEFESVIHDEDGIIAWRRGTGDNVELTYLLVKDSKRDGSGRRLVARMVEKLMANPPYSTVYGFTRCGNLAAQQFYKSLGFSVNPVHGVYADGEAMVFSCKFSDLVTTLFILWPLEPR